MRNLKERAEEIFDETISGYNKTVSRVYAFQFNKEEKELFLNMMKRYAEEVIKEASERVKITFSSCGDPMTCGCMGNCDHAVPRINKQSILNLIDEL